MATATDEAIKAIRSLKWFAQGLCADKAYKATATRIRQDQDPSIRAFWQEVSEILTSGLDEMKQRLQPPEAMMDELGGPDA
jgi:hypothetical protein